MSGERYLRYLPARLQELKEFRGLSQAEGPILQEEAAAKDRLIKNQWILTAEWSGLLRLAAMMGMETKGKDTETLREEILYQWNSKSPYTYFHLLDWLDGYCGEGAYWAELFRAEYRLSVTLELSIKEKKTFLEKHLRRMIPANLLLEIWLNTNTHGKLTCMSHGGMNRQPWTHGQLPFEDLSAFGQAMGQKTL